MLTEIEAQDVEDGRAWVEIRPTGKDTPSGPELGLYFENTLKHTALTYTECAEELIRLVNY